MGGVHQIMRDNKIVQAATTTANGGLPAATASTAKSLPGELRDEVNETILMHGTNPDVLLNILSSGPNERFSGTNAGTAFGDGTYFAEDAGKNDQYVKVDAQYQGSDLHKRLYDSASDHPGSVYYILACRVALGCHVRTHNFGNGACSVDDNMPVFPVSFRELATVPNVSPPVHYHSLVADIIDVGYRYREFIVFHQEFIYPEYLLAYQRV